MDFRNIRRVLFKIATVIVGVIFFAYILFGDKLENYYVKLNEDDSTQSLTITGFKGIRRNITIPAIIKKAPVTGIGDQAFSGVDLVEIIPGLYGPDPLEKIKKKARGFELFDLDKWVYERSRGKIKNITMSNGIRTIGDWAFYGNRIKSVIFSDNLEYIGNGAFSVNKMSEVVLPTTVTFIDSYAFSGNSITKIVIGDNVIMDTTSFDNGFPLFYLSKHKKAGTYIYSNGEWNQVLSDR